MSAQTEGYDPANPPLPNFPEESKDTLYTLTVNSSPYGSGSLNTSGGQYREGASVGLRAYNNEGMYFMFWVDDEGQTISTASSFTYVMPKRDAVVTAVYRYDPSNPSLPEIPEEPAQTYNLTLKTKPEGAGSFNTSSTSLEENASIHLYAYTNTHFYFKHWEDAAGQIISTAQNFYYTMPAADTQIYAVYDYNPANPGNPARNFYDSFTGEVVVDDFTPGGLNSAIYEVTNGNTSNVTSIVVAGAVNNYDFSIANNYSTCTIVDLSRTHGATSVPSYCYANNTTLNRIALPASITRIEYYAFGGATGLTELTCHATVPPTLEESVFDGVTDGLMVYVPSSSVALYEQADGWKDYEADGTIVIMPIQNQVVSLEVNLPEECADGRYKNMPLELLNVKSGQRFKYVITDRVNYIFNHLVKGTRYVALLKNPAGALLAKSDTLNIDETSVSYTFDLENMKQLRSVKATVQQPDGTDVTADCKIVWCEGDGSFLSQEPVLTAQVSETSVRCSVTLPQTLAMEFVCPADTLYEVVEADNNLTITLAALPKMQIAGSVWDVTTRQAVKNANVTVSQTLNGKYSKSFTVKTDNKGSYSVDAFAAPTSVTWAATDYVSQTITLEDSQLKADTCRLEDALLKPITGATITTDFTYTTSVAAGVEPEVQNDYVDYSNVAYSIYNVTTQQEIRQFNVQYPTIVLLEEVSEGDSLQVTAKSKTGAFMDVTEAGCIDSTMRMRVTLPIVQLGGIDALFTTTENSKVLGILYDSKGTLVNKYNYATASLSIRDLKDGEYTLVTMGASDFFGSIYNLEKFSEAGLQQNIDYLVNKVTVQSGTISPVKNVLVPFFDESKFYYTGENTSFSVNKTSIVAGNYLTLTAKVDFKEVYKNSISDVRVSVELPEGTSMVDNSVMVGSSVAYYELNGQTLTIPLDNNVSSDRVRFCVIPTQSGSFTPSAIVAFKLGEKNVSQPMGSTSYTVKDIAISVPSEINTPEITVTGVASGKAEVVVYANGDVLGTTKALANGYWCLTTELDEPYNLQEFEIYADVTSSTGLSVKTETQKCLYNKDIIVAKTVDMTFYNGWMKKNITVTFDLEHQTSDATSYSFYHDTDFTFAANLSNNDTTIVKGVTIGVYTNHEGWIDLDATYNAKMNRWVAVHKFGSNNLPTGVRVDIDAFFNSVIDAKLYDNTVMMYDSIRHELFVRENEITEISTALSLEWEKDNYDNAIVESIKNEIYNTLGYTYDAQRVKVYDEEELDVLIAKCDSLLNDSISMFKDNFLAQTIYEINGLFEGITISNTDGLDEGNLESLGFEKIIKSDSQCIYIYSSSTEYKLVDFSNNIYYVVDLQNNESTLAKVLRKAESNDEFPEKMQAYIRALEEGADRLRSYMSQLASTIEDIERVVEVRNGKIADQLFDLDQTIISLEKKGASKFLIAPLKLKYNALVAEGALNAKILGWFEKNISKNGLRVGRLGGGLFATFDIVKVSMDMVRDLNNVIDVYFKIPNPCENDASKANSLKNAVVGMGIAAGIYYGAQIVSDAVQITLAITGSVGALPSGGTTLSAVGIAISLAVANIAASEVYAANFDKNLNKLERQIRSLKCEDDKCPKCHKDPCECENPCPTCKHKPCLCCVYCNHYPCTCTFCSKCGKRKQFCTCKPCKKCGQIDCICKPEPEISPILDPSGYVYEGVSSNRLPGVTATCYYKEIVEDMYGDLHEEIVLWDAEEYGQRNPLFTDENGMYQWDVPQGLWQVRFEKEGYVPTQSEWLPVPPPQMDVNIAMVQNAQPEVVKARAYEDGVELEFSKYMNIETLNADNIYVKVVKDEQESLVTDAVISMLNQEAAIAGSSEEYTSKVKLATDRLGYYDEAYLIVSTGVRSYAGIPMAQTFEQKLDVEKKVRELKVDEVFNVEYNGQKEITIAAVPAEAAVGRKLAVLSASEMIATTDVQEVTFDDDGQATFTVSGELYGSTALNYTLQDADLTATSIINVVDPSKLEAVKIPVASRISGTAVYRGQTVALSCETDGAVIYYTTDGSCPCDEAKRVKYERPIAINDAMTLKFMAVGTNFDESDVQECTYSIRQSNVKLALAKGWNWSSHDVASPVAVGELSGIASQVLTQTANAIDDPILGLVGTLKTIDGSETMKIDAKEAAEKAFAGEQYNPALSPITLHEGWNWLGYPIAQTMTLGDALSYVDADEGDCITSLDGGFATYTDGAWEGTLETMSPGAGYLYKAVAGKSFIYNNVPTVLNAKALYGHRLEASSVPWSVDKHRYPNLMPVIAQVCYANGVAADTPCYVAAFADDECRGVGKYVDGRLYLSVYGDKATTLTFKAWNADWASEQQLSETLTFVPDVVGSAAEPFRFMLGDVPTGIGHVNAAAGADGLYNLQGIRVNRASKGGVYIIRTTGADGTSVVRKVIVNK